VSRSTRETVLESFEQAFLATEKLMDLSQIAKTVSQSGTELADLKAAVRQLLARVDRHALVIQVLKDMLLAKSETSEVEFLEHLEHAAVDKANARTCPKCGKAMSVKHNRCLYCGEAPPPEHL
jgi:hypothetical protein